MIMIKRGADVGVALYLMAAIIFFIVPIPSFLLDVLLIFNISVALVILFNCLFVQEVLDMSFFPTLLLFTTIIVCHKYLNTYLFSVYLE